ncbi:MULTISPECIES: GNAT family N-acetyltransferase [unclassified Paenibacillus]|uniref:GNAT family N-acetyltransferase n=1 Tax=unclassified Paenibacillus TaxID=185978 RepID=UPI0003E27954|nr:MULTISPECIES: GNAT family N-acetyltransferase [unclassified Paenibacillus]ETT50248.1 hypothetical protein C162_11776 [Paenibacillus sp. FSL R7-269]
MDENTMINETTIHEAGISEVEFNEIFAIMEASFPVSEIRTRTGQQALLDRPNYHLYTSKDAEGEILAFLAAWELPELRFIEHIAVNPECRSGGIGRKLMSSYLMRSDKPVLLEVEPPDGELEQRRIGFYERLGFYLNPYNYMQPPLRAGQADLPLRIMTYPEPVTMKEFRRFRDILYTEVYGVGV